MTEKSKSRGVVDDRIGNSEKGTYVEYRIPRPAIGTSHKVNVALRDHPSRYDAEVPIPTSYEEVLQESSEIELLCGDIEQSLQVLDAAVANLETSILSALCDVKDAEKDKSDPGRPCSSKLSCRLNEMNNRVARASYRVRQLTERSQL